MPSAFSKLTLLAKHLVSQNKRRYADGEYDLDLSYITEDIIAMGFPAGHASSGLIGRVEGLYRNNIDQVIDFLEEKHGGKYKIYNLCSERAYDPSLFDGVVATFPFDDHNCPPLQLLPAFCESAKNWLSRGIDNVVVVHCKAGKSRTGLMVCCLLLYLRYFSTAAEVMNFYNKRRTQDGKGLTLPSQRRYVRYYETVLREGNEIREKKRRVMHMVRLFNWPVGEVARLPKVTVSDHNNGVVFKSKRVMYTEAPAGGEEVKGKGTDFSYNSNADEVYKGSADASVAFNGRACPPHGAWRVLSSSCLELMLPKVPISGDFKLLIKTGMARPIYLWANTSYSESYIRLPGHSLDHFGAHKRILPSFFIEIFMPTEEEDRAGIDENSYPLSPAPSLSRKSALCHAKKAMLREREGEAGGEGKAATTERMNRVDEETDVMVNLDLPSSSTSPHQLVCHEEEEEEHFDDSGDESAEDQGEEDDLSDDEVTPSGDKRCYSNKNNNNDTM